MLHHPRGEVRHGRLSSETNITDLVRLLRETEEGRGLGLSYSEALGKAMGDDFEETTVTRRIIRRGLTLLAKAPSLGRKRSSRVTPSALEVGQYSLVSQQQRQKTHSKRTFSRQGGVAPSDGGLIRVPQSQTGEERSDQKEKFGGRSVDNRSDAKPSPLLSGAPEGARTRLPIETDKDVNLTYVEGSHSDHNSRHTTWNEDPITAESVSDQLQQKASLLPHPASPPSLERRLPANDPTLTVTEADIRRVYTALRQESSIFDKKGTLPVPMAEEASERGCSSRSASAKPTIPLGDEHQESTPVVAEREVSMTMHSTGKPVKFSYRDTPTMSPGKETSPMLPRLKQGPPHPPRLATTAPRVAAARTNAPKEGAPLQMCNVETVPTLTTQASLSRFVLLDNGRPSENIMLPVEPQAAKLVDGLGIWANEAVTVGRLVDENGRRVAERIAGAEQEERGMRRLIEQEMGDTVKSLPLSFLKGYGYSLKAQQEGLEKITRVVESISRQFFEYAWRRWRQHATSLKLKKQASGLSTAATIARGYLARRLFAKMRRADKEAKKEDAKRTLLRRRLAKVSGASRLISSCLIAHAAARRRERVRFLRRSVAMVERVFIYHKNKRKGWREIAQYQNEQDAAGRIQRWTRGVLVRRRVPLVRRIHRMDLADKRFEARDEVFVAHLVDHGAAVVLQKWWRSLPWKMRRLRARYKYLLDKRAAVIQRAYRRRLRRRASRMKYLKAGIEGVTATVVNTGAILSRAMGTMASGKQGHSLLDRADVGSGGHKLGAASRFAQKAAAVARASKAVGRAFAIEHGAPGMGDHGTLRIPKTADDFVNILGRLGASAPCRSILLLRSPFKLLERRRKKEAAITVQGLLMIMSARIKMRNLINTKEREAAKVIQKLYRDQKFNELIQRRQDLFQSVLRQAAHRQIAKSKSVLVVNAFGTRYIQRRRFIKTRRLTIRCQALVRGWLGRREVLSSLTYTQHLGEERALGALRWEQLLQKRQQEELLSGARSEALTEDLELQKIFLKYCQFGDRRNTGRMQLAKLMTLCKDAGIIDAKRLPAQRVEISFSRLKPKDLSHLQYPGFLASLEDLAQQHSQIRKLAEAAAARAREESGFTKAATLTADTGGDLKKKIGTHPNNSASPRTIPVNNLRNNPGRGPGRQGYQGLTASGKISKTKKPSMVRKTAKKETPREKEKDKTGMFPGEFCLDDQRLLIILQKYVLVKSKPGKEVCTELEAEGRGSRQRALCRLQKAAVHIQAILARGYAGRKRANEAQERKDIKRAEAKMFSAVRLVQTRIRIFLAQTRVSKLAMKRFYRCLDSLTGAEYYFDPKTGKASWTKPKILGKFEIPTAVIIPAGEEILVPMCKECDEEVATEICAECDEDMFCDLCIKRLHRSGNYVTHLRVTIDKCDECLFQVAVKQCKQCNDNFCASCFGHVHRKGQLRKHFFEPLVAMCHDCGERAQAQRCFGCEPEGRLLLCKPCQAARHVGLADYILSFHRIEALGLRSMKVKRLQAEKLARAREQVLNVETAEMGRKKREAMRWAAALKIQTAWRGFLARKRRAYLVAQNVLWMMQRLKDDMSSSNETTNDSSSDGTTSSNITDGGGSVFLPIRKKVTYKLRLFLGKAPLLKSDTNQEMVLKQYPRWWRITIMDIIRSGIGWHEAAKMVREQQFFKKKARRRGRWRLLVARARVVKARRLLGQAGRKQRKLEGVHARAVEEYQQARAKGGVRAHNKEALQQASRKAKRAANNHAEEQGKAEGLIRKANNGLESLTGPFRLRETVRTALKRGLLMPFRVSVQRRKSLAKLQRGHKQREVLKWMPYGRHVRIEPEETLSPSPPPRSMGPFCVRGVKETQAQKKPSSEVTADLTAAVSSLLEIQGGFKTKNAGGGTAGTVVGKAAGTSTLVGTGPNGDAPGGKSGGGAGSAEDSEKEEALDSKASPTPVLMLGRQWLLPDNASCRAYAMPALPLPQNYLRVIKKAFRENLLSQLLVKATVVATHVHSGQLEKWQENFDEDSDMYARLERWAAGSESLSESLMFQRLAHFDVDTGFEMKRKATEVADFALEMWHRAQELAEMAKSAVATELVSKNGSNKKGAGGKGTALDREVVQHLFKKWVRSDDREKVIIMHRSGAEASEAVVEVAGHIMIDLDTPTPILREFIRRFCGGWLNEHAKGEQFLIENSVGVLVRRSLEGSKGTATSMDMIQERVNKSTRDTEAVVFVQDEADRKDPEAEMESPLIPDKDLLDPDAELSFEDEDGSGKNEGGSDTGFRGKEGGKASGGAARKKKQNGNETDGAGNGSDDDSSSVDQVSEENSSECFSHESSVGFMGRNLEDRAEDPFAAMEKDEEERKGEAGGMAAAAAAAQYL